jgi:hypothetical protein
MALKLDFINWIIDSEYIWNTLGAMFVRMWYPKQVANPSLSHKSLGLQIKFIKLLPNCNKVPEEEMAEFMDQNVRATDILQYSLRW